MSPPAGDQPDWQRAVATAPQMGATWTGYNIQIDAVGWYSSVIPANPARKGLVCFAPYDTGFVYISFHPEQPAIVYMFGYDYWEMPAPISPQAIDIYVLIVPTGSDRITFNELT